MTSRRLRPVDAGTHAGTFVTRKGRRREGRSPMGSMPAMRGEVPGPPQRFDSLPLAKMRSDS